MEPKPGRAMTVIAAVFIALTIIMAGLFVLEYSAHNAEGSKYSSLQSSYSAQQKSVVLNDAYSHWNYISIENSTLVKGQYSSNATLDWIGGPLNGTYSGPSAIQGTWNKFFHAWSSVWYYTEAPPAVSVNGNSAKVSSENQFVLTPSGNGTQAQYIDVNYTLNYASSNGSWQITRGTWDINGAGYVSSQQQFAYDNYAKSLAYQQWNDLALLNDKQATSLFQSNGTLHFVGGKLPGTYNGTTAINDTWKNFTTMWTNIWYHAYMNPMVKQHGNMYNVTDMVEFVGPTSKNPSVDRYLNVTFKIEFQDMGFDSSTGVPQFLIHSEVFMVDSMS